MSHTVVVSSVPILLDQILSAEFGPVAARDLLAETLRINPGLASDGPVLPLGRGVLLPDAPDRPAPAAAPVDIFG